MKPINIAMMSMTHGHTRKYYQVLKENPKLNWVAVSTANEEVKKNFKDKVDGIPCYDSEIEMFEAHPEIEAVVLASGIMLCVLSFVPTILFDTDWAPAIFMFIVAVGVGLIIISGAKKRAYDELFKKNVKKKKSSYKNPSVRKIMSLYWTTVTCLYISYSFITFEWHRSWIIWPIAAVINALIRAIFTEGEDE